MDDGAGYGVETEQLQTAQGMVSGLADSLPGGAMVCFVPAVPVTGDDALQTALSAFDTDWSMGDTRVWDDLTHLAGALGQAADYYVRAETRAQARIAAIRLMAQTLPGWMSVSQAVAP